MLRYLIALILVIAAIVSLFFLILKIQGDASIVFNIWSYELKTSSLLIILLFSFIGFYILLGVLRYLFSLKRRIRTMNAKRRSSKASRELIQGLLLFSEGHWNRAEKLLLKNAEHNETPVINYLAAARAAHFQEAFERRDELLMQAVEHDPKADVVVSVSQAEMHMDSGQDSQAQATLLRLQELSPNHPYISKLLAKVYFKKKNWSSLFELLPSLLKQKNLKENDVRKFKLAAIKGLFEEHAKQQNIDEIQKSWKKLPASLRKRPNAIKLYAESLNQAGASELASDALTSHISDEWNEDLIELYGKLSHKDPVAAESKASKWLTDSNTENPTLLLALARLNMQKQLWGKAKSFYETSLNLRPNSIGYFELAKLLEQIGETDNANTCHRIGLRYCIEKKADRLNLKTESTPDKTGTVDNLDSEEFYTV